MKKTLIVILSLCAAALYTPAVAQPYEEFYKEKREEGGYTFGILSSSMEVYRTGNTLFNEPGVVRMKDGSPIPGDARSMPDYFKDIDGKLAETVDLAQRALTWEEHRHFRGNKQFQVFMFIDSDTGHIVQLYFSGLDVADFYDAPAAMFERIENNLMQNLTFELTELGRKLTYIFTYVYFHIGFEPDYEPVPPPLWPNRRESFLGEITKKLVSPRGEIIGEVSGGATANTAGGTAAGATDEQGGQNGGTPTGDNPLPADDPTAPPVYQYDIAPSWTVASQTRFAKYLYPQTAPRNLADAPPGTVKVGTPLPLPDNMFTQQKKSLAQVWDVEGGIPDNILGKDMYVALYVDRTGKVTGISYTFSSGEIYQAIPYRVLARMDEILIGLQIPLVEAEVLPDVNVRWWKQTVYRQEDK